MDAGADLVVEAELSAERERETERELLFICVTVTGMCVYSKIHVFIHTWTWP